jgi:hypothetical protein
VQEQQFRGFSGVFVAPHWRTLFVCCPAGEQLTGRFTAVEHGNSKNTPSVRSNTSYYTAGFTLIVPGVPFSVCNSSGPAYYEFNFAPSTQWAAYRFDSYRSGMRVATEISAPRIEVRSSRAFYILRASLEIDQMSSLRIDGAWRIGLAAVIEETSGHISYWALVHPPGKADFHHADSFAVEFSKA